MGAKSPKIGLISAALLVLVVGLLAGGCKKKPKGPGCTGNGDCEDGKICRENVCQMCQSDADCGDGKTCNAGACEAAATKPDTSGKTACKTDDQCADDEDCVDGFCEKPWSTNSSAGDASCTLATVYFAYDDDSISDLERDKLGTNEQCLAKATDKQVYLFGHTDDTGTDEYNIALSERRAAAVADYLARLGVDPARMQVVPKGETQPSGAGADKDRRVEFSWK